MLIEKIIGDEVIGFFERKFISLDQEVRVFIPVYATAKPKGFVN